MQKKIKKFSCGCEWEVAVDDSGEVIGINYEPENANLNCPKMYELLASGKTKGIFQLETPLGQSTSHKCRPYGVEELSDVISIVRPGSSDSLIDGKTLKQHYIDRKNGLEPVVPPHPLLSEILKDTQGVFVYQEQAMVASQILAGFDGKTSDLLRAAIGKKKADVMAQLKDKFIEGCKANSGLSQEEAENIFAILEAGQRYSFNKSHGVSYAINALKFSCYPKSHFPRIFFLSELEHSRGTIKENIMEVRGKIIDDAMNFGVKIRKPDLRLMNSDFLLKDRKIYYGLTKIKGVGEGKFKKLVKSINGQSVENFNWMTLLSHLSKLSSDSAKNLILSGSIDYMHLTRSRMVFEYNIFCGLSDKCKEFIIQYNSIEAGLNELLKQDVGRGKMFATKKSKEKIEDALTVYHNNPASLKDTKAKLSKWEIELLGYPFTCTEIDGEDGGNCTCQEFIENKELDEYHITCIINEVKPYVTKGKKPGQDMAFIGIKDGTQSVSAVAFPEIWLENKQRLFPGNKALVMGTRGNNNSLIIKKVFQL